jgi:hypothetical protein
MLPNSVLWSLVLKSTPRPGQQTGLALSLNTHQASSALPTRHGTPKERRKPTERRASLKPKKLAEDTGYTTRDSITSRERRKHMRYSWKRKKLAEDTGYTSRDSITQAQIFASRFRIEQIKTKNLASNTKHSQYLSLSNNGASLHHSVLGKWEGYTSLWSSYSHHEALRFNLKFDSMTEFYHSKDSMKIIIIVKDDPVCVSFSWETTRSHFLKFCSTANPAIKFCIISW